MNRAAKPEYVTSADGTALAYEQQGDGPSLVVIGGAAADRRGAAPFAAALASEFTVFTFDRRGRGDSGDTLPYAVDRELEDLGAMLDAAGGSAHVLGTSSGAVLALKAAARGAAVRRLVMWEPPYMVDAAHRPPRDAARTIERLVAEDRRGDAVEYFFTQVVGMPPEAVAAARKQPQWSAQEKMAHTLAYDDRILGDYAVPRDEGAQVAVPTLILTGAKSMPFFEATAEALAEVMHDARADVLDGQQHVADPKVLAPVVTAFLKGNPPGRP